MWNGVCLVSGWHSNWKGKSCYCVCVFCYTACHTWCLHVCVMLLEAHMVFTCMCDAPGSTHGVYMYVWCSWKHTWCLHVCVMLLEVSLSGIFTSYQSLPDPHESRQTWDNNHIYLLLQTRHYAVHIYSNVKLMTFAENSFFTCNSKWVAFVEHKMIAQSLVGN